MLDSQSISVIIPVYNAGERLISSISSLLKQIHKNIEIIIVNDASTDNSYSIINNLAKDYVNIIPIHLKKNIGVHEARLIGLKQASSSWIGFMDADDYVPEDMYSSLIEVALEKEVDIVVCGMRRVTDKRELISTKFKITDAYKVENDIFRKFCAFEFGTASLCNKIYKREIIKPFENLHFPWRQNINEDLLLNIGCFYTAKSIYISGDVFYEYVMNESSATSTISKASAFVETYRAYALAISSYSYLGKEAIKDIIEMYRIQLTRNSYSFHSLNSTSSQAYKLKEAVQLLYSVDISSLALIVARMEQSPITIKLALKTIIYRVLLKLGFRF